MSPLEGQVYHINYMFIHLTYIPQIEIYVPKKSTTPDFEQKIWKMKSVLNVMPIFKKSWSL
jgi:hypothetical protein